jgi:sensor histidine kinase YesM
LITLEEEIEFIKSYIFLIDTRFENNIQFNIEIEDDAYYSMLPPLTLQLLIENAIKHNIITESRPLKIKIEGKNHRLRVVNTLYEKPEDLKSKSGTGLKNIKERYSYFSSENVLFQKTSTEYIADVPLIEIETI